MSLRPQSSMSSTLRWRLLLLALVLLALIALSLAWRSEALAPWLSPQKLLTALQQGAQALGPLLMLGLMVLALVLAMPLSLLCLLVLAALGPWPGLALCFGAAALSACVSHGLGHALGHELLLRLAGPKVQLLSESLGRRGLRSVVILRLLPIAPFAVVNMVAGATHIRLWQMVLGTLIGMAPSTVFMAVFIQPLLDALLQR